ncbi:uncharacterized protein LOC123535068 [Mercenaria mercenaria]|uniref:uncharacterized protein LOC123535068 n=1 Tax=Mercenaria mercenaria TaxID=6596 RepID=UPI00234E728D|nr:uncharacterized protein LOC123535068 [Mercenaria mercenaria]
MEQFINIILILILSANGTAKHTDDCHGKDCVAVSEAIQNIGSYFDDHLCHAFKDVDCAYHVLTNDEQICGSDGNTYSNHCVFAKARCVRVLDKHNYVHHQLVNPLLVASHGPCGASTVNPSAETTSIKLTTGSTGTTSVFTNGGNTVKGTTVPTTTAQVISTNAPVSSTTAPSSPRPFTVSTSFTPFSATTTVSTAVPSTTVSTHSILGSVFCQFKGSINCGTDLTVVCGSDGKFYPNMCELLKAKCVNATLREVSDSSSCSLHH